VFRGKHAARHFDDAVELMPCQIDSLVSNRANDEASLQEFLDKFFAGYGVVGAEMIELSVLAEMGGIFDGVLR